MSFSTKVKDKLQLLNVGDNDVLAFTTKGRQKFVCHVSDLARIPGRKSCSFIKLRILFFRFVYGLCFSSDILAADLDNPILVDLI